MMKNIPIFFALLRSGLYGSEIPERELPESIDWEAVLRLARIQTVLGFIIDAAQRLPRHLRPGPEIAAKMSKTALSLIKTNLVLENAASKLVALLKPYGVSGVILKGIGVAHYYPHSQMRHGGDIDFYVGKSQYGKTIQACLKEGLISRNPDPREVHKHFEFHIGSVMIEVHRLAATLFHPFRKEAFQDWMVDQLEHSPARRELQIGGETVVFPSVDFDAIYVFYHAWNHYVIGGVGLRQLCDWAMIFHSRGDEIDRAKLVENIRRFDLTKGWKLFACIAVNHLGVPAEKMPLYDPRYTKKSEQILADILRIGNFGFHSEEFGRMKKEGFVGKRYALTKVVSMTKRYLALYPYVSWEATGCYLTRLLQGPLDIIKRSRDAINRVPHNEPETSPKARYGRD